MYVICEPVAKAFGVPLHPSAGDGEGAYMKSTGESMKRQVVVVVGLISLQAVTVAQRDPSGNSVRVALVKMPYVGERNTAERSGGPDYLEQGGIQALLEGRGCRTRPTSTVALTADEQKAYGEWNRLGLANGDLATIVADAPTI
jgi:hypothetical protein